MLRGYAQFKKRYMLLLLVPFSVELLYYLFSVNNKIEPCSDLVNYIN